MVKRLNREEQLELLRQLKEDISEDHLEGEALAVTTRAMRKQRTTSEEQQRTTSSEGKQRTTSEEQQRTTSSEGKQRTTSSEGKQSTTSEEQQRTTSSGREQSTTSEEQQRTTSSGREQSTTSEEQQRTTSSRGKQRTTSSRGKQGTTSEEQQRTTSSEGKQRTTSSEGKQSTTSEEQQRTTSSGREQSTTSEEQQRTTSSGREQSTTSEEQQRTTSSRGKQRTTSSRGKQGTTSEEQQRTTSSGRKQSTTSEEQQGTTSSEGKQSTTTSEEQQRTTSSGREQSTTTSEEQQRTTSSGRKQRTTSEEQQGTTSSEGKQSTTTSEEQQRTTSSGREQTTTSVEQQRTTSSGREQTDYTFNSNTLTLPAFKAKTCTSLHIINDDLLEPLYESFTLTISGITPENSNFILDSIPSTIQIQDNEMTQRLTEDVTVHCYRSAVDCTSNTNGVILGAIDCCNRTGGGYISHSSATRQCGACVVVGFDQSHVHIGPSDAGRRYSFTADVLLSTPGAPDVIDLDYVISREPPTLVDVADYLSIEFAGQTNGFLPERFSIRYVSQGNAVALQPTLSFNYTIAVETDPGDPPVPSGVVLVYRHLSITIEDIDIITVGLEPPSMVLEGMNAVAVIGRQVITHEAPFKVTVSLERYTGPLSRDEAAVGLFDFFNFTEQRSAVFQPATAIHERFEHLTFFMPRDNIVELQEVFMWRLRVNDSRVRLDPEKTTQIVRLDNRDIFSIGFRDLYITIREGDVAPLTIKQIGDEKGGEDIGGYPEGRLQPARLRHISGSASNGSDFFLDDIAPRLTYRANNTLNDIPFAPITSIDDNIIEGNETIRVIIVPGGDNVVQIQRDRQTATITIIDNDIGMLSLERGTYDVIENEGTVEICAVLTGGVLPTNTEITILASDDTARFRSDYSTRRVRPTLPAFGNKTCGRFSVMNDFIREQLFENFTVAISSIYPENNGLTIDQNSSFIRIQDDDQAEVRFAMGQATFSEGGGNQSITVILGGGQLSQEQTIEVYIDDGTSNGISLGFVTFGTGAVTQNRTVVFPVVDNNIALEPDKHYLLRLRNIGNIGLGNPGTMNVTVEDDDVKQEFLEDEIVRCYSSAADCTSNTNGVSLAAIDCCNRTGGGYISHSSLTAQCGACVVVGFDQSRVHIGPSDAGKEYRFTANLLFETPGAPDVRDLDYIISREPAVDVADYLSSDFAGRTNAFLPETFRIRYLSQGNAVALQPTLSFDYLIAAETDAVAGDPPIPSGVVLVYRRLSITIEDIDIITVGLQEPSIVLEGSTATARVERQIIAYEAPFVATVSNERYTGPLAPDEAAVGDFDGFNFTEQHSVVFQPAKANDERFGNVSFLMPHDGIVELQEVFIWRLSVNDSRVRISTDTQIVRLDSQDVFSIGFKNLHVTIREGEVATLTIKQIGDETGGEDIGGFPEDRLSLVQLKHASGTATNGADFSLNDTVPRLTLRANNTLNNIPFTPITSIDDNIIKGNETIRVTIVPGTDNVVQVQRDRQTATIIIIDDDTGVLSLERGTYDVIENEGTVEICAVLTGGVLSENTTIDIRPRNNTAQLRSDYSTRRILPILLAFTNRTCGRFNIIDDFIREPLFENFTIAISGIFPENSALTIDQAPSFIRIQDDDQAEVRFAMGQATFSEGGGNQSITVILGGTQLSQEQTMEVYIDDGASNGVSLGFVTFGTGVLTQNRSINFPVADNNIALEPNKHYLLRLRNIGNIGLSNPGTMNVTVEDDDDVSVIFVQSSYNYNESHGTVSNIQVQLSNPIAQDLSVNIGGGPGSQPSSVFVSGAVVSESIRFIAGGSASVSLSNFALIDDAVALEVVEQYDLSLINHDYTDEPSRVSLGSNTTLSITDDDVVNVTFGSQMYSFFENEGTAQVSVRLSRIISQTFTVRVEGGPVNQSITFNPAQRVGPISFGLNDDLVALEDPERFQLRFSRHSFPDGSKVRLGSNSQVSILDNDVVSVTFAQSSYSYFESNGTASNIMLRLNATIARSLSVLVLGGPGSQPSSVVVSGADVSSTVTFAVVGSFTVPLPSFVITNDDAALEELESYSLSISNPSITQNVIAADSTDIDITDDDIITVNLEPPSVIFLEGSNAVAVIKREAITYKAAFEVTVSNERYTGPLSVDEAAVGDFDGFNFTEQHSVVFQPAKANDEHFENVSFLMPRDGIVELQEAFRWRLSVNDSRVRINTDTQIVRLDDRDVFSIGFKDLHVTIIEGQVATLTIKQIGNETGGVDIGGFPEGRLSPVRLRQVSGTATNGSDFLLNSTGPRFTLRANNTLNDILFQPITIDDNIIEGDETIRVIIVPEMYGLIQVVKEWQTATITIVDDD
uniref:Calx-beta domain-containing protein n=1 Tax=Amphimedon queenslandica TaxID=400682 RepID=A0A1X7TCU3_AMPQE